MPSCVGFITWSQPVPYTTPLYFFEKEDSVFLSFSDKGNDKDWVQSSFSPLYVLTKEPTPTTIYVGDDNKKWFKMDENGHPQFKFVNENGRCIPHPDGNDFLDCSLRHDLDYVRPTSLLEYLRQNNKKQSRKVLILGIIAVIMSILAIVVYWYISRSINRQ